MRRRALLKTTPIAATLPLAGCLDSLSSGEDEPTDAAPEGWEAVDSMASEHVTFEPGEFETTAADPPAEGDTLDGNEAWNLVTETSWALREASFQLALESFLVEGEHEGTWRHTLWRNAETDQVYQRQEIKRPDEPYVTIREYNDGTRHVAADRGDGTEHFHVPDPHWHRDRVDTFLMMSLFQLREFEAEATVTVDGTDLRRVRHTNATADDVEMESAVFFVGEDGVVRNGHADYGTGAGTPTEDRYEVDGAVEITAGTPEIAEPPWTDDALDEEKEPFEGPA